MKYNDLLVELDKEYVITLYNLAIEKAHELKQTYITFYAENSGTIEIKFYDTQADDSNEVDTHI